MIRWYRSSIVARQAIASTVTMLVAIGLIALAAAATAERQQERALLALIDTDIAGLTDGMTAGGTAEVARRIKERSEFDTLSGAQYRLADPSGRLLAGQLPAPATLDPARSEWGRIAAPRGPLLARATLLRGGYRLVVARSLAPARALTGRILALFGWAALPAAAVSLVVGAMLARRLGRSVERLNATFEAFEQGEHDRRAGLAGRSDEIATLARHVDHHLAQTARLIETQRGISDNIAHELRTPLGHLDTRLLHMLATTHDEAITRELHEARDDIRTIVSLFEALLDLALAEGHRADGRRTVTFDLSERIADLAELYAASAEESAIDFVARIAPAITMRGEAMAMTRAVANLLDNAFKAAPPGSQIRLLVSEGPRIVVEDNGPGIADAERAEIFERVKGARRFKNGHGLGLALVRVIAIRHGLVASFEDAGPGARFILAPGTST